MVKQKNIASESWISRMSNKIKAGGGINLAQGIPGFDPPIELLDTLKGMSLEQVHQYPPGNGQAKLVDQICDRYSDYDVIKSDEVLVVQGATEGISLVYMYLNSRFGSDWSALAFDPVYESYNELPKIFNNNLIKIPFESGAVADMDLVERALKENKVKLVFVNSPGNPLGKIWSSEDFNRLFRLAEKYDFFVLVDAVYKDLCFGEQQPFYPLGGSRERLFYVNSFSKMLSITGWRVGYLITDRAMMQEIRAIHDYTGLCAPSILQYSISEYLAEYNYGYNYINDIKERLSLNYQFAKNKLEALNFYVEEAGGGYFIWCRLPEETGTGVDFALDLYDKQKVGVIPGIHFYSEAHNWIRINIARDRDELAKALLCIATFLKENR